MPRFTTISLFAGSLILALVLDARAGTLWVSGSFTRPIDPATNLPVPNGNVTDFHMRFDVTGRRGVGQGMPMDPTVSGFTNGRHVANVPPPSDPQFSDPTVTVLNGLPVVNPMTGVTRTDTVELSWNTVRNPPFVFSPALLYMSFGGRVQFDGSLAQFNSAEWTRNNGGPINAPIRGIYGFQRRNSYEFTYTNEEGQSVFLSDLRFEARSTPLETDQLDVAAILGGMTLSYVEVFINDSSQPLSPSYNLAPNDQIEFVFPGDLPEVITFQGYLNFADGRTTGLALQYMDVIPEPAAWLLALMALAWLPYAVGRQGRSRVRGRSRQC